MKERPILFSAPMVRAILEGRKTQTRRIVSEFPAGEGYVQMLNSGYGEWSPDGGFDQGVRWAKPRYGKPGDRLWVREAWAAHMGWDDIKPSELTRDSDSNFWWAADRKGREGSAGIPEARRGKWRPSIHMPRWASRITLEITEVRVQRLQEISEEDGIAEGVERVVIGEGWRNYRRDPEDEVVGIPPAPTAYDSFMRLWMMLNGETSYNTNPWVWAITFKVVQP